MIWPGTGKKGESGDAPKPSETPKTEAKPEPKKKESP